MFVNVKNGSQWVKLHLLNEEDLDPCTIRNPNMSAHNNLLIWTGRFVWPPHKLLIRLELHFSGCIKFRFYLHRRSFVETVLCVCNKYVLQIAAAVVFTNVSMYMKQYWKGDLDICDHKLGESISNHILLLQYAFVGGPGFQLSRFMSPPTSDLTSRFKEMRH